MGTAADDRLVVTYRATMSLPYEHLERATAGLRGQLRLMAIAGGVSPDWTTLLIEGPVEAMGLHGATWYEWTATLKVGSDDA